MGREIKLFVASQESLEEFAAQIERVLNVHFNSEDVTRLKFNPEHTAYVFRDETDKRWFTIQRPPHPFMNDGDKAFTDYEYQMRIGAYGSEMDSRTREFANWIFDRLKATNQYPLMMVEGIHPKLDQFDPTPSADSA